MPESRVIVTEEAGGAQGALFPSDSVVASSQASGWNGVSAERLLLSLDTPEHHHDSYFLTLQLGPSARVEWKEGGRHQNGRILSGEFTLIGADVPHLVRYEGADVLAVSLSPELVRRVTEASTEGRVTEGVEFVPQNSGTSDRQVERIGLLLKDEMEAGFPSGQLFGESLGQALAAHLLRHYSSLTPIGPQNLSEPSHLSPRQLHRALDFIEENLNRDIALAEIAEAVGLTSYHFARQFKATVGIPPHAYLIERRIERAKSLLKTTSMPIAQIASAVGFANQSHLTRHFRRRVGATPAQFR